MAEAESEMICDFAEVYHIYDYQALPLEYAATLFSGLGADSRTNIKLRGEIYPTDTMLLAVIADRLSTLVWFESEDGHRGENRPVSILESLTGTNEVEQQDNKPKAFNTKEELDAALAEYEEGE